jgi:hypothetical protein
VRRGDQAHIHADGSRATKALESLFLQCAQKFRLQVEADVANLVEKQRTVSASSNRPRFWIRAPVNAPRPRSNSYSSEGAKLSPMLAGLPV